MNAKALKILLLVTVACVAAAFVFQQFSRPGRHAEELPERVVPDLTDRLNDIASIDITSGVETLKLRHDGGQWVLPDKGGYPAKFETVKSLLVGLADLQPRERKTANPELYDRLGLADPGEGSESLGVKLGAADGSAVADLVLGSQVNQGSTQQRYVRAVGDPQTWLAEGRIDAPTDPNRWLDTSITQIPRDRITRVTITQPDGRAVSIAREQGGTDFTLETPVPEGRTPKSAGQIGAPAGALAGLRFDDVHQGDQPPADMNATDPVVTVFETTDDLRITVRSWQADGKTWATLHAEAIAKPAETKSGETKSEETKSEETKAEDASKADAGEPADAKNDSDKGDSGSADNADQPAKGDATASDTAEPKPESAQDRADTLNAKLVGWLFSIPQYQAGLLRKTIDDLTDAPKPAENDAQPDAQPGDQPLQGIPGLDAADKPDGGG